MDEILKNEFKFDGHDDTITRVMTQPTENIILNRNSELRKNNGAIQDLGSQSGDTWGRQVASIPFVMFEKAIRDGYDLNCKDSKIAQKELMRYLQSSEGQACLIRGKS